MILLSLLVFLAGMTIVGVTFLSAIRTIVLPRSASDRLSRKVFLAVRFVFDLRTRFANTYAARDRVMALYSPVSLLALLIVWLLLVMGGYTCMFWALGARSLQEAFTLSGSSLFTLGFATIKTFPQTVLAFSESMFGLILVALLISYLPTMYSAFSQRESVVTLLEVRAGSPPSAVEMIVRYHRLGRLDKLNELWVTWELWFAYVEESHTSLAALTFFRSPQPDHSWVTAAGAVLDSAALILSTVDVPQDVQANLCLRAGYLALRRIASFFKIAYDPNPGPGDPISITKDEFDEVYNRLVVEGVAVKPDRNQAWHDFAGWRVNYDTVLLSLATLTMAPYAPWSSDRSLPRPRQITLRETEIATTLEEQLAGGEIDSISR